VAPPAAPSDDNRAWVTLARVVRPRGRIGEVAAEILTDFPDRLTRLQAAFLLDPAGRRRSVRIARCWLATSRGGQAIFHFAGVNSIDDAKKLVGCEVQVPLADRAPLPAGRYFVTDLIGCQVLEEQDVKEGKEVEELKEKPLRGDPSFTSLGLVRDVYFESGTPLLAVATPTGELLIPLAEEICIRIDPAVRRIEVRLPAGLRDLNPS
jgi:16S rRNA processing protein RimM